MIFPIYIQCLINMPRSVGISLNIHISESTMQIITVLLLTAAAAIAVDDEITVVSVVLVAPDHFAMVANMDCLSMTPRHLRSVIDKMTQWRGKDRPISILNAQ